MFRRPGTGRSKASADTLCQKCLKRGHYSYECKASAQERPYQSRPSRTQQLLNPKLKPKLTTEVPEDLVRKKGLADEILKKKERERSGRDRKRSRSLSASSADSVSTISTNRSPSRSRSPPRQRKHNGAPSRGDNKALTKRRKRSVSRESRSPDGSERNTRRRMSSFSPGERGRRRTRSRSVSQRMDMSHEAPRQKEAHGRHRRLTQSRSRSSHRRRHGKRPARRPSPSRSRSRSPDPMDTSDDREPQSRNGASKARAAPSSRSPSPYRPGRDRSPSPYAKRPVRPRSPSPPRRNVYQGQGEARGPPRNRFDSAPVRQAPPPVQAPPVQRERSLSPFSKRVALTKAMQAGRI
ncbi:hypothetical protein CC86DRAFT_365662 [Ophiobolus disseminans]|uniref:Zinc knuckle-domain-containing protein n=1 Tax=Ophiobolus disseminans TaxID=1469910 RepID=A0A6A7ALN6_9PLEO|nr:hypothetical protein CC86DRAFT_365662 [Ophiobolus disseminans]